MDELGVDVPLYYPSLWTLFTVGCFVWPGLFIIFWSLLCKRYPPYLACGTAMRLVSSVHAVFEVSLGAVIMSRTYRDVFYKDCKLLDQTFALATMYWLYDVVAMYMVYCREKEMMRAPVAASLNRFLRENPLLCFHHLVVLGGGHPLTLYYRFGKAAFMIASVQVTELSTPFINIRKIFIKHNCTKSSLFKVNTALAVATFFLTRIVLFPCIYVIYAYAYHLTLWEVVTSMYFGCHFVMCGVIVIQVTWFSAFVKALSKERKPRTNQNGHQQERTEQNGNHFGHEIGYTKKSE